MPVASEDEFFDEDVTIEDTDLLNATIREINKVHDDLEIARLEKKANEEKKRNIR